MRRRTSVTIRHDDEVLASRNPFQLGYVTTDIEQAVDTYRNELGIGRFSVADRELHVESPTGPLTVHARIALAFVDDLMIEFIQPIGGDAQIYSDALPRKGFAMVLHHLGYLVDSARIEWPQFRGLLDERVVFEKAGDPSHLYVDTRSTLGHYIEYIWLSSERMTELRSRVPQDRRSG
jgi:hypothetical protein